MINVSTRTLILIMVFMAVAMYFLGACDDSAIRGR